MSRRLNLLLLAMVALCGLSWLCAREAEGPVAGPAADPAATAAPRVGPADGGFASPPHVLVLNGTPAEGLARRAGLALTLAGCVAEGVGNAPHDSFAASLLVNRRLPEAAGRRLARLLGGVRLVEEKDARAREDAVLILGADHERLLAALQSRGAR